MIRRALIVALGSLTALSSASEGAGHWTAERADEPRNKAEFVNPLLEAAFAWAREAKPSQPLTSAVWRDAGRLDALDATKRIQLAHSDVVSFHCYDAPEKFRACVESLRTLGRPLLCTEYMARPWANLDPLLGDLRARKVAAYCWGFVAGRTQTIYPVKSWREPFTAEPEVWNNELLHPDGTPYRREEADYIRKTTRTPDR